MSPEDQRVWEEDAETEYAEAHAQARPATHSPADAEEVSQDVGEVERARVARYAEALDVAASAHYVPMGEDDSCVCGGVWSGLHYRDGLVEAMVAVADEERAALVAEMATLTEWFEAADAAANRRMDQSIKWMERAESAEAEVERLRVRLAKVEAIPERWVAMVHERYCGTPPSCGLSDRSSCEGTIGSDEVRLLRKAIGAALADAPTEQTKGGE